MTTEMTQAPTFENILYEVKDRVAIITRNRPEKLNALNTGLHNDESNALKLADKDPNVRCVVLTGAGRAFSAGGDLKDYFAGDERGYRGGPFTTPRDIRKPVIAAVNGICFGAALIGLSEFDVVVSSDQARYCFMEVRFGAGGGTDLPFLVGPQWAKIMILGGEEISAHTARRIGLVAEVVPHAELMARTLDLAHRFATMPPEAVRAHKALINGTMDIMGMVATRAFAKQLESQREGPSPMDVAATPDGRRLLDILFNEGMEAFKAARDSAWRERWVKDE